MNGRLQLKDKLKVYSWMLFDWACQPIHTLIATFIFGPYFVQAVVDNPVEGQALIGMAVTVSGIVVAIFSPILGAVADQTQKRKPWILMFSVFFVISTFFLWFAEPNLENTFWVLLAYTIGFIAADFSTVFTNAMMPSLEKPEKLGKLSGAGWGLGYLGGLVSLIIMLSLFVEQENGLTLLGNNPALGLDPSEREGTRIVGPLTALWYVIFMIPFFVFVPDVKMTTPSQLDVKKAIGDLLLNIVNLRKQPSLGWFLVASMFYRDAMNGIFFFGGIYAAGVLEMNTVQLGIFGILAAATGTIGAYWGGALDSKYGSKFCISFMLGGLVIVTLVIFGLSRSEFYGIALDPKSYTPDIIFYIAGGLLGFVSGPIQSASRTLLVFLADERQITENFGLYALVGRATAFLAPALITWFTLASGSQQIGLVPIIILLLIGWYLLRFVNVKKRV
jgi:UMF1 family MFS transporter